LRSHFLEHVSSVEAAELVLGQLLAGQERPWVLRAPDGDVVAYFKVETVLDGEVNCHVCADISGRHYNQEASAIDVLKHIQKVAGGVLDQSSN
jgi:hypothetical protein